jgi:[acyl-carrier-protein] S-malonyltransferase
MNLAVLAVLQEKGITPIAVAGHSLGEYAANVAAGVLEPAQAVALTRERGRLMQACADQRPGSMVAVIGLDMADVDRICQEVAAESGGSVSVANFNSPQQVVITGESEPVAAATAKLTEAGAKRTVELPVSGPWHSTLMQEAQEQFGQVLSGISLKAPTIPLYANVDAEVKSDADQVRDALTRQITGSVRWTQIIQTLRAAYPDALFIECGPGKVLKGLLRQIDRDAKCFGVECPKSLDATLAKLGS